MTEKFLNAYHFLPLDDGVAPVSHGDALGSRNIWRYGVGTGARSTDRVGFGALAGDGHARYVEGRHSGLIRCRLRTCTPTVVGGRLEKGEPREKEDPEKRAARYNILHPFELDRQPAIPATSLKGLVSSTFEALSASSMRVLHQRPLTERKRMDDALHALGRLVKRNEAWWLEPLTLPLVKVDASGRVRIAPGTGKSAIWASVFRRYAGLKMLVGNYKQRGFDLEALKNHLNISGKFAFCYAQLNDHFSNGWPHVEAAMGRGSIPLHTKGRIENPIILGHASVDLADAPASGEEAQWTRGFLRVLGVDDRGMEGTTKKHEVFIPYPEGAEGLIASQAIPVMPQAIARFEETARHVAERTNADLGTDTRGLRMRKPFLPFALDTGAPAASDWDTDKKGVVRPKLRAGQIVYFDVEKHGDDTVVSEISFSAIWRRSALKENDDPATIDDMVEPTVESPSNSRRRANLLPMGRGTRTVVTPAERLFGFVSAEEGEAPTTPRALAGRLRFSNARLASTPDDGSPWLAETMPQTPGGPESFIPLKELSAPKPPSRAMYFREDGAGPGRKRNFRTGTSTPQGRKVYLHQDPEHPIREPWRTRVSQERDTNSEDAAAHRKTAVRPLAPNVGFTFDIRFDNLSDDELALLVYALAPSPAFRHKLGYGKPLGLGTVEIVVDAVETLDRAARYAGEDVFGDRKAGTHDVETLRGAGRTLADRTAPRANAAWLTVGEQHCETPAGEKHGLPVLPVPLTTFQHKALERGLFLSETETFEWFVANEQGKDEPRQSLEPLVHAGGQRRKLRDCALTTRRRSGETNEPLFEDLVTAAILKGTVSNLGKGNFIIQLDEASAKRLRRRSVTVAMAELEKAGRRGDDESVAFSVDAHGEAIDVRRIVPVPLSERVPFEQRRFTTRSRAAAPASATRSAQSSEDPDAPRNPRPPHSNPAPSAAPPPPGQQRPTGVLQQVDPRTGNGVFIIDGTGRTARASEDALKRLKQPIAPGVRASFELEETKNGLVARRLKDA